VKQFNFLYFFNLVENYRLVNGQKIILWFLKNKQYLKRICLEKFKDNNFIICLGLLIVMSSVLIKIYNYKDYNLTINFESKQFNKAQFILVDYITYNLVSIGKKFNLNNIYFIEFISIITGLISILISNHFIKKSIISNCKITANFFVLSCFISYFIGFIFVNNDLQIKLFLSLYFIYKSLILLKDNKNNSIVNISLGAIGCLIFFIKWQFIIITLILEFWLFLNQKKYSINNPRSKVILGYFLLRIIGFISIFLIFKDFLTITSLKQIILSDLSNIEFINHRIFSYDLLNEFYRFNNDKMIIDFLTHELWIIFFSLLIIPLVNFFNNKKTDKIFYFFYLIFFASIIITCLSPNIDSFSKAIFYSLNFPAIIFILVELFKRSLINFKRHGLTILIALSIAIFDHKIYFKIFFNLPLFWFVIWLVYSLKKNYLEILNHHKNFLLNKLKFSKANIFYSKKIILIFNIFLIIGYLFLLIKINYLMLWILGIVLLLAIIVYTNWVDFIFFKKSRINFFTTLIIVLNFIYFVGNSFGVIGLIRSFNNLEFNYQNISARNYLRNELKTNFQDSSKILNIYLADKFSNDSFNLIFPSDRTDIYLLNDFNLSKIIADQNIKLIALNNNPRISVNRCLISNFESILISEEFKNKLKKNFIFYKNLRISTNDFNNLNFYKNNYSFNNNSFLVHDVILLKRN